MNDAVCKRAGKVRGVIHEMWVVDRKEHPDIKDIRVVGGHGLQVRKTTLGHTTPPHTTPRLKVSRRLLHVVLFGPCARDEFVGWVGGTVVVVVPCLNVS